MHTGYHFGRNLRRLRRQAELTQGDLAQLVTRTGAGRWSQSDVSLYENASACANGRFADAAASVLKVPVMVLYAPLDDAAGCSAAVKTLLDVRKRMSAVA